MRPLMSRTALALLIALPLCVHVRSAQAPTDAQLKADVEKRLADVRLGSLKVTAADGTVTLSGKLASAGAKQDAIDAARKALGLKFVVSQIDIPRIDDRGLALDVGEELKRSPEYTVYDDVTGGVREGVVTLRGRVVSPGQVDRLGTLVAHIRGVQTVNNELRAMATSLSDDSLRVRIAEAIYYDPSFLNLSMTTMPPIHIIVENGRVTLIGRVHTEIESKRAMVLAQMVAGAPRVENQLKVDR